MTDLQASQPDNDFINRTRYWCLVAAVNVMAEASTTALHDQRVQLAQRILYTPLEMAPLFAQAAMTNTTLKAKTIFADITEGELEFTVNSVFNHFLT